MSNNNYITAHCFIVGGHVSRNGVARFKRNSETNEFLLSFYQYLQLNYPKFYKMDNLSKLGWLTAEVLLSGTNLNQHYKPEKVAIILANASSSLDDDLKYFDSVADVASPSLFVYTLPNIVMGEISIRHNLKGEQAFFVQEEFDAAFIEQQVSYLLKNNKAQSCVCGWVDVLGADYKSVLFLVEKHKNQNGVLFSTGEMERIYYTAIKA